MPKKVLAAVDDSIRSGEAAADTGRLAALI
jgi:hypothetical protein